MGPTICHANNTSPWMKQPRVHFIFERFSPYGFTSCPSSSWITTLNHKIPKRKVDINLKNTKHDIKPTIIERQKSLSTIPYVSMKSYSIVIASFTKSDEVLTCPRGYITMQLNVQIAMCGVQLNVTLLLGIFLSHDIFEIIFCDRIIRGWCEGSWSSTSGITALYLEKSPSQKMLKPTIVCPTMWHFHSMSWS